MVIHKQEVSYRNGNTQNVKLPMYAQILSCDFQGDNLVFWYMFSEIYRDDLHERLLFLMRTGESSGKPIGVSPKFIGTAYDRDVVNPFVIHLFELTEL